jgi:hypothetical protein
MENFVIFDNGGKTLDRFTIVNRETGDVFGTSENPDAPNGVGKFCGNCSDHLIVLYGTGWRQKRRLKKEIKAEAENYINNAKLDPAWLGNEVKFEKLPEDVRIYISHLDPVRPFRDYTKATLVYMSNGDDDIISGSALH